MPLDPSIALQTQTPNPANMISGFLDIGRKKLELNKAQDTYGADVSQRNAESARANTEAGVAAQTAAPRVAQQVAQTAGAQAQANTAQLENLRAHIANGVQSSSDLLSLPDSQLTPDVIRQSVTQSLTNAGAPPDAVNQALARLPQDGTPPAELRKFLVGSLQKNLTIQGQLDSKYPTPNQLNDGQTTTPVQAGNQALTGAVPNTPVGPPTQNKPPPTTPVFNPKTNQMELLGSQPGGVAPGTTPTAPGLGVSGNVDANIATNAAHRTQMQANADAAGTKLAALQTIKQEVPTALTGHGDAGDFLRYLSKLWGGDTATSNDVMAKNLAIIAGNAGNTDAARALGEMGTPNYHMTPEAAQKTAEQLMGILRKDQAAGQLFGTLQPNDPGYAAKRDLWNRNADPRAFEFAAKSQSERAQMKFEMKKAGTWDALNAKMHTLDAMGVNP
jgi:hypothetical protein